MNIYKVKLLIYIQENLFKIYMHYKSYITHGCTFVNENQK
jgi:hypothetical protein